MKSRFRHQAFSLVELLVAIAIIGVLAAMIMPQFGKMTERAQSVTCMNNLKQLMISWQMYQLDNNDLIVQSYHGGMATGGAAANVMVNGVQANAPWCEGWLDWTTSSDRVMGYAAASAR